MNKLLFNWTVVLKNSQHIRLVTCLEDEIKLKKMLQLLNAFYAITFEIRYSFILSRPIIVLKKRGGIIAVKLEK